MTVTVLFTSFLRTEDVPVEGQTVQFVDQVEEVEDGQQITFNIIPGTEGLSNI